MKTIAEPRPLISLPVGRAVQTRVDSESPATRETSRDQGDRDRQIRERWQKLIDEKLLEWLRDPCEVQDEGIEQPSGTILRLAIDLAEKFRDDGLAPPDRVVPDPNGGILFERRADGVTEVFHIWEDDGTVEYQRFDNSKLVDRREL